MLELIPLSNSFNSNGLEIAIDLISWKNVKLCEQNRFLVDQDI